MLFFLNLYPKQEILQKKEGKKKRRKKGTSDCVLSSILWLPKTHSARISSECCMPGQMQWLNWGRGLLLQNYTRVFCGFSNCGNWSWFDCAKLHVHQQVAGFPSKLSIKFKPPFLRLSLRFLPLWLKCLSAPFHLIGGNIIPFRYTSFCFLLKNPSTAINWAFFLSFCYSRKPLLRHLKH